MATSSPAEVAVPSDAADDLELLGGSEPGGGGETLEPPAARVATLPWVTQPGVATPPPSPPP
eukprot:8632222-Alexandrium_andersonii.AAC.1